MIRPLLVAALLWVQDAPDPFKPGDASGKTWILFGPAEVADDTDLVLSARRIERRWDAAKSGWTEIKSDITHIRSAAVAARGRFEASLKSGPAGRYFVRVGTEEKGLAADEVALGSLEPVFARGPEDVRKILGLIEKSIEYLNEIERYMKHPEEATPKAREDFSSRVADTEKRAQLCAEETDLTGSVRLLLDQLHHIHDVQIWKADKPPPPLTNDSAFEKKHVFIQPDLTMGQVKTRLEAIRGALDIEIKISTSLILHRLFLHAGSEERRLDAARAAARAASKMAEAAPTPDKDFVRLLDQAADRSSKPAESAAQLRQSGLALILP